MDLYSGLPYWIAKNKLYNYFRPLPEDLETEIVIVGGGITGALIAHELCHNGIPCTLIDKRSLSTGSSVASTALLQYEIDTPMHILAQQYGEEFAYKAYLSCLQSITDLEKVFHQVRFNPDFTKVPSIYYASDPKGVKSIRQEYELRRKYRLPVTYLSDQELEKDYGFSAPCALVNNVSAQMDPYAASTHLLRYHMERGSLCVFTQTEIIKFKRLVHGYALTTGTGKKITCKYLIVAAGFESGNFLPKKVMELTSTYAILSQPVPEEEFWPGKALIWETADPYLYIRTSGNRILVGGEDIEFKSPVARDALLRKKVRILEKKFAKLFPNIPFKTDMAWCGTFSSTSDGLPFIGNWPGLPNMFYALGYGGNGITFSMIAAQIIRHKLQGYKDDREEIFGFERDKLTPF